MPSLDKSKPYGEVYGVHFASFEQDGRYFDSQGNEVVAKVEPAAEPSGEVAALVPLAGLAAQPAKRGRKPKGA